MRLLILLMFFPALAWAEYVDLTGSLILGKGICEIEKEVLPCAVVERDSKKYLIVFDKEGELQQWEITPDGKVTLLWSRNAI